MPTRVAAILAGLASAALFACERPPPPPASAPSAPPTAAAPSGPAPAAPAQAGPPVQPSALGPPTVAALAPAPALAPASTPGPVASPPVASPPVEVLEAQALIPGATTPLESGVQVTVDPGATFRVRLKGTYPDARLSLLDAGDDMVPSAGAREAGATTTVTLQPSSPLKPGGGYRLRVDGATTRELQAADGTARAPVEFSILAAGEPPAAPRAKLKKAKKHP